MFYIVKTVIGCDDGNTQKKELVKVTSEYSLITLQISLQLRSVQVQCIIVMREMKVHKIYIMAMCLKFWLFSTDLDLVQLSRRNTLRWWWWSLLLIIVNYHELFCGSNLNNESSSYRRPVCQPVHTRSPMKWCPAGKLWAGFTLYVAN